MTLSRLAVSLVFVLLALPAHGAEGDSSSAASPAGQALAASPDELLSRLSSEPNVRQVQQWAVAEAGLERRWEREMLRDARARGGLPLIRLRGRYQDASKRDWDEVDLLEGRNHRADYMVDLWLEWDLAELASSSDLLRAVREGRALVELRQAVLHRATVDYYDRRRLRVEELMGGSEDLQVAVDRRLRLQELDATLDGLTGGRWLQGLAEGVAADQPPSPDGRGSEATVAHIEPHGRQAGGVAREDPHSGLRVPVHPTDRPPDP